MDDLERLETRLDNLRSVRPVLGALRTISLASWRTALGRRSAIQRYAARLTDVLAALPEELRGSEFGASPEATRHVVMAIGSERGLAGRFSEAVVERADRHLTQLTSAGDDIELLVLGTRTSRHLQRRNRSPVWEGKLSLTSLPPYRLALELASDWLERFRTGELKAVTLVFNDYRGVGQYATTIRRVLPPQFPTAEGDEDRMSGPPWPPIIETDPVSLYNHVIEQWTAVTVYRTMIDSAVAEHSARYQLMEGATQNADHLVERLTLDVQNARKQAITREMQELAAGAGMLGQHRS
ncbi:MAG: hypothetical protein GX601_13520 [Anaerolineales bacterium]|nr:hypothetical protein [Anaerolineales bacterium]